jgi:hypothetical protein
VNKFDITSKELPGLYQSADKASLDAQNKYFGCLKWYLLLLVCAAFVSYVSPLNVAGALLSASLFLVTLGILIFLRVERPDDVWYNGRAVAESVKTISWRWMMKAEPYEECERLEIVSKSFVNDLKTILQQNKSLSHSLQSTDILNEPISQVMKIVRALPIQERLEVYVDQRIKNQAGWYWKKSRFNKRRAKQWFWLSVFLHATAIAMLLYRINSPAFTLPVEVVSTAAGAALTWLQAKKHNEQNSAYALAAHEIVLIKEESTSVHNEQDLSEYVVNSEAAFSREHTQWVARKGD